MTSEQGVNIQPSSEDINQVFQNNPVAAQQLQITTLVRLVKEKDDEIASLKEELASKNGTGSLEEMEKVT